MFKFSGYLKSKIKNMIIKKKVKCLFEARYNYK